MIESDVFYVAVVKRVKFVCLVGDDFRAVVMLVKWVYRKKEGKKSPVSATGAGVSMMTE